MLLLSKVVIYKSEERRLICFLDKWIKKKLLSNSLATQLLRNFLTMLAILLIISVLLVVSEWYIGKKICLFHVLILVNMGKKFLWRNMCE